ncbi:hypothetical protein F7Q88_18900, partial [Castellaniella defragrans]
GAKVKGKDKVYSWHADEVECISKGKARTPYEFGVKVGIVTTLMPRSRNIALNTEANSNVSPTRSAECLNGARRWSRSLGI